MIEWFIAGCFAGSVAIGLAWALVEIRRQLSKPPRQVIYRKGKPPEVILR